MALSPVIAWHICSGDFSTALWEIAFAGALDVGDGWVARNFAGQSSLLGTFLDPLADKILIASVCLSLGWVGILHPLAIAIFIGRDVGLVAAGLLHRAQTRPQGKEK